jgi:multiple sugar transport system permease protein
MSTHFDTGLVPSMGKKKQDHKWFDPVSLVFLSPAGLLIFLMFLAPVGYSFYLGLTNLQLIGPNSENYWFTGWTNLAVMFSDTEFYKSLWLTLVFVVGSGAIGSTLGGLVLAILMAEAIPAISLLAGIAAMLACILPPVTVAVIWKASSTAGGVFPFLLGITHSELLYNYPMTVVSVANAWWLCGLSMLMFAAALRNIPSEMKEAALLERASAVQRFLRISVPALRPTILTSALLMSLLSFGNFTLIFLMTGGGPANQTNILPLYSYLQGFTHHRLGYGALLGNVVVVLSALIGVVLVSVSYLSARRSTSVKKWSA